MRPPHGADADARGDELLDGKRQRQFDVVAKGRLGRLEAGVKQSRRKPIIARIGNGIRQAQTGESFRGAIGPDAIDPAKTRTEFDPLDPCGQPSQIQRIVAASLQLDERPGGLHRTSRIGAFGQ